jgi:glycosyltransferase involved in cell wall biosynthesis
VCARNEGVVIKSLLNSFNELDYPSQLQTIFICVNNSTDDTLSIIQEYIKISKVKIYIIEKPFKQNNNKGKTIDFLLNYINQHYLNKFDRYAF